MGTGGTIGTGGVRTGGVSGTGGGLSTGGAVGTGGTAGAGGQTGITVDTIDPNPESAPAGTQGPIGTKVNFYTVTKSRTLRKIEQYLSPTTPVELTWYVHEATSQLGTYTKIFSTTTTSTTGTGYQSSGDISVPLVAGRYYGISVRWTEPTNYVYRSAGSVTLSFGSMTSGQMITTTGEPSLAYKPTNSYYPQRLTTGP